MDLLGEAVCSSNDPLVADERSPADVTPKPVETHLPWPATCRGVSPPNNTAVQTDQPTAYCETV